jgi:hypothetical protein
MEGAPPPGSCLAPLEAGALDLERKRFQSARRAAALSGAIPKQKAALMNGLLDRIRQDPGLYFSQLGRHRPLVQLAGNPERAVQLTEEIVTAIPATARDTLAHSAVALLARTMAEGGGRGTREAAARVLTVAWKH